MSHTVSLANPLARQILDLPTYGLQDSQHVGLADLCHVPGELRIQVENAHSYRGGAAGMRPRLEDIRGQAAATRLYAATVGLLLPDRLAEPAENWPNRQVPWPIR